MVLAGAGGVKHDELVKLANKYFGSLSGSNENLGSPLTRCRFTGERLSLKINFVDIILNFQILPHGL
jgi:processing peptidase subunit beta